MLYTDLSKKQDKELVELLIDGSKPAFGELYARYRKQLMYTCKQYAIDEADAEDIVNDIFLKLWETRHLLGTISYFSGYVQKMAQNYVLEKFRHVEVHSRFAGNVFLNGTDSTNETEDSIIDNDYTRLLDELIESLPLRQKEIFRLSRIEGLSYKEIAELLQISVPAVQKHTSLALQKIKKNLERHADIHFQIAKAILILYFIL
jgi:RNA polymerase sigma-70 factor (ECF subfamily)